MITKENIKEYNSNWSLLNCVPRVLKMWSRANVSCVLTCLACLHVNVLTCLVCLRANVAYMLLCSRANMSCVLTCRLACLRALRAYVLTCQCVLRAHVPTCLVCLRANVSRVLTCSRGNVPYVPCTVLATWLACSRTESIYFFFEEKLFFCPAF